MLQLHGFLFIMFICLFIDSMIFKFLFYCKEGDPIKIYKYISEVIWEEYEQGGELDNLVG